MKLNKTIYKLALAVAGVCMLASCTQPTDTPKPEPDTVQPGGDNPVEPEIPAEKTTLENVKKDLSIDTTVLYNVKNIELKKEINGVTISWKASNNDVINSSNGNVIHGEYDVIVKLTATLSINGADDKIYTDTKVFDVTVIGSSTTVKPEQNPLFEATKNLSIKNEVCENEDKIELPNNLPGFEGVSIAWESKNAGIIDNNGNVKHTEGSGADNVTLTATLTKDNYKLAKDFVVSVRQKKLLGTVTKEVDVGTETKKTFKIDFYNDYLETDWPPATTEFVNFRYSYKKDGEGFLLLKLKEMYLRECAGAEVRWYTIEEYRQAMAMEPDLRDTYGMWASEERTKEFRVKYKFDNTSSKKLNLTTVFTPGLKINEQHGTYSSENKNESLSIFSYVKRHGGLKVGEKQYALTFTDDSYTTCTSCIEGVEGNKQDGGNWSLNFDETNGSVTMTGGLNNESYTLNFTGMEIW